MNLKTYQFTTKDSVNRLAMAVWMNWAKNGEKSLTSAFLMNKASKEITQNSFEDKYSSSCSK